MNFYLISRISEISEKGVYLLHDNWDDWFEYEIAYKIYLKTNRLKDLGRVKIAMKNQSERVVDIPSSFTQLSEDYVSIGFSEDYYDNLKNTKYREIILGALNDIAFNIELYEPIKNNRVVRNAIMREYSESKLRGQLQRLAKGKARLTDYNLEYVFPYENPLTKEKVSMQFDVERNRRPYSNIHVLVGKNGIGKTTLLKKMIFALEDNNKLGNPGAMEGVDRRTLANIVFVSFSAFDNPIFQSDLGEQCPLNYQYVGLIEEKHVKSRESLINEFVETSYKLYTNSSKMDLWEETVYRLGSDEVFDSMDIYSWITKENKEVWKNEIDEYSTSYPMGLISPQEKRNMLKSKHEEFIKDRFAVLSSGHKVILLTLAHLIDLVEEKTIVLLDEPEEHLHPPLVAAFIQALSNILIYRNGMGIIATHSPVVVQEVPKRCVWILERYGKYIIPRRPECETYGENLGELTSEIFGYEVEKSGFHKEIIEAVELNGDYDNIIGFFGNQLGKEAKSIIRAYTYKND